MSELSYLLGVLLSLAAYAVAAVAIWAAVEAGYWVYCKVKGIDY
jgi:fucose permease